MNSQPITPPPACPNPSCGYEGHTLADGSHWVFHPIYEMCFKCNSVWWEHELRQAREVLKSVKRAAVLVTEHVGCLDGGCRFIRPSGMHTNSVCRCVGHGRDPLAVSALAVLYKAAAKLAEAATQEGDDA